MSWKKIKTDQGVLFLNRRLADAMLEAGARDFYAFLGKFTRQVQDRNETTFMVLKDFLPPGAGIHQAVCKRYSMPRKNGKVKDIFRPGKAVREFKHACEFEAAGLSVPAPLAAFEARKPTIYESFFLVEDLAGATNVRDLAEEPDGELSDPERLHHFVKKLGRFIGECHEKGMFHGDLNGTNVLSKPDGAGGWNFWIIDFAHAKIVKNLSMYQRIKDLARLEKSLGFYTRLSEGLRFFTSYAEGHPELYEQRKEIAVRIRRRILRREETRRRDSRRGKRTEKLISRYKKGEPGEVK